MDHVRLFVSFPEEQVDQPVIYDLVRQFDVVPNIRRANVEEHSGWMILELSGAQAKLDGAVEHLTGLGCTVNPMEGDVLEG